MDAPDVNVLVYAHRADEATHATYRAWLDSVAGGSGLMIDRISGLG